MFKFAILQSGESVEVKKHQTQKSIIIDRLMQQPVSYESKESVMVQGVGNQVYPQAVQPQYVQPVQYAPQIMQPRLIQQPMQQVFTCEVDATHANFQATEKCEFCFKMMCLKCSCRNSPASTMYGGGYGGYGYGGAYSAWWMKNNCCKICSSKCEEVKAKYGWVLWFHIIMIIIGASMFTPCLLIGGILGAVIACCIPNDKFHRYYKNTNLIFTIVHWIIFIVFAVVIALCFIPIFVMIPLMY